MTDLGDAVELRRVEWPDGRALVLRRGTLDDVPAIVDLYRRLSPEDLRRRFFVARRPRTEQVRRWVGQQLELGGVVVIEQTAPDRDPLLVAEASYVGLPNGNAEVGLTVDPDLRGWIGGWLLDAVIEDAAAHGHPGLEADVLVDNRPMLALLRHRGSATMDHEDWSVVRVLISTTATTPDWPGRPDPDDDRPRVLIGLGGGAWSAEAAAEEAGLEVMSCPGPEGPHPRCPVLQGQPCPLVGGADLVVLSPPRDELARRVAEGLADLHPTTRIVTREELRNPGHGHPPCRSTDAVIERITELCGTSQAATG